MQCIERKRLVAQHLKAIAAWKQVVTTRFQGAEHPAAVDPWKDALEKERIVLEHCQWHGCDELPMAFARPKM